MTECLFLVTMSASVLRSRRALFGYQSLKRPYLASSSAPQGSETRLQKSQPHRGLTPVVLTLRRCSEETRGSPSLPAFSLPSLLSPPSHHRSLPSLHQSTPTTVSSGGGGAHASALLPLQERIWLGWNVLERTPLDIKELGCFLSRKASLNSCGLASLSASNRNLI